jgi:predicted P-loop ATPase
MPATLDISLNKKHFEEWKASAVKEAIINLNVQTIDDPREVNKILGRNASRKWGLTSDLIPAWYASGVDPLTDEPTLQGVQVKPDKSPIGTDGKPQKYIGASGMETAPLFLRTEKEGLWKSVIDDLSQWVFGCEGAKKAASLLSIDIPAISIPGVTTCRKLGRLHQNLALFAKPGRNFVLAYDNDLMFKKGVQDGLEGMGRELRAAGAKVWVLLLPEGEAKGVDDFLALHGEAAFRELLKSPETLPTFEEWLEKKKELETENEERVPKSKFGKRLHLIKKAWGEGLKYNVLKQTIELNGNILDPDELQVIINEEFDIDIGKQESYTIVRTLARRQSYSPVVDYLNEVEAKFPEPDLTFLDDLAFKFFGSDNPLHARYLKSFLVASVARARQPGIKYDEAFILTGAQGKAKSTFWKTLYGDEFFSDDFVDKSDKDEKMKMHSYWCLEYAEINDVYKQKDVEEVKRFISRQKDTYRAPYDIKDKEHLRPFVLTGTANNAQMLQDRTGNRRFMIVPVLLDFIPTDFVQENKDKIWATANALFKNGYQFVLSKDEEAQMEILNREYIDEEPWDEPIASFVEDREFFTLAQIYQFLDIPFAQQNMMHQKRITKILRFLGYEQHRDGRDGPRGWRKVEDKNNNNNTNGIVECENFAGSAGSAGSLKNSTPETQTSQGLQAAPLQQPPLFDTSLNSAPLQEITLDHSKYSHTNTSRDSDPADPVIQHENFSSDISINSPSNSTEVVQPVDDIPPSVEQQEDDGLMEGLDLIRMALSKEDYEYATLFDGLPQDYRKAVFDLLTPEEQAKLRQMRDRRQGVGVRSQELDPTTEAEAIRKALANKDWKRIEELDKYWEKEFGQESRQRVWDALTHQERETARILKPGNAPKIEGIPLFEEGNIVWVFGKLLKITAIKQGDKLEGYFSKEVTPSVVEMVDVFACNQSKLFTVKVKDKVKVVAGKYKDKIFTVSSIAGNIIWCKGDGRGATPRSFYSHQLEKL